MDQSAREVVSLEVRMVFGDGRVEVVNLNSIKRVKEDWKIYHRVTESHINDDQQKPTHLFTEYQLVWSRKTPWIKPEDRAKLEAVKGG